MTQVDGEPVELVVDIRALAVPSNKPVDGECVAQVVETGLVARAHFPTDPSAGAYPPKTLFRDLRG